MKNNNKIYRTVLEMKNEIQCALRVWRTAPTNRTEQSKEEEKEEGE